MALCRTCGGIIPCHCHLQPSVRNGWGQLPDDGPGRGAPLTVPRGLHDRLAGMPDGADVTSLFRSDDPAWRVLSLTLLRRDKGMSLLCRSVVELESE